MGSKVEASTVTLVCQLDVDLTAILMAGILSALSFCPSGSFFAAGSLSPPSINGANIALFNEEDADNGKAVGWIGFSDAAVRAPVSQASISSHHYASFNIAPFFLIISFRSRSIHTNRTSFMLPFAAMQASMRGTSEATHSRQYRCSIALPTPLPQVWLPRHGRARRQTSG